MTDQDKKKIKSMNEFVAKVNHLLDKYPEIKLYGDHNGNVAAHTTIGTGLVTKSHSVLIDKSNFKK